MTSRSWFSFKLRLLFCRNQNNTNAPLAIINNDKEIPALNKKPSLNIAYPNPYLTSVLLQSVF